MALLTTQTITNTGINPSFAAVAASDTVVCGDTVMVRIKNASGAGITATITTPNTVEGLAIADAVSMTIPATTGDVTIGPIKASLFADSSGVATITCSSTASVTIAALRV